MRHLLQWSVPAGIFLLGFVIGKLLIISLLERTSIGLALLAVSIVFTLATSLLFRIFSLLNNEPPSRSSDARKDRYLRKIGYRRRVVMSRWVVSIVCSSLAAISGAILRSPDGEYSFWTGVGFGAFLLSAVWCFLALSEYLQITKAQREWPIELEKRRKKQEFLASYSVEKKK